MNNFTETKVIGEVEVSTKKTVSAWKVVANTFNPRTQEVEAGECEFKTNSEIFSHKLFLFISIRFIIVTHN